MRKRTCRVLALAICAACSPARRPGGSGGEQADASNCARQCAADQRTVVDCSGNVLQTCSDTETCDPNASTCANACAIAEAQHSSVGCEYYATYMESFGFGEANPPLCFAAFVANTFATPAHIGVDYKGQALQVATFAAMPTGAPPILSYNVYDPNVGIPPGQVAILFLGGSEGQGPLHCPMPAAAATPMLIGTGLSDSFRITSDVPVVAYQINPYGGGSVEVTGASLLIPTSAWDTNYVAVNVSPQDDPTATPPFNPSLNIVAQDDDTVVTIVPRVAVGGGPGIAATAANQPLTIALAKGQNAQITQGGELTGSIVTANKPIGFMAGQYCMRWPLGTMFCDHGEQMVPPVRALGHRYAGVMYRPRTVNETQTYWRLVGVVDGTQLTWSAQVGGPATLAKGESVTFATGTPFVVASQDKDHPFMLFTYMTSSDFLLPDRGYGDPDFVYDVPTDQFLSRYVFFTDPTYPETNLVLVRARDASQQFHDVTLDCLGAVQGWQPIDVDHEWARVDLQTGDFHAVGKCTNGRHEIRSDAPFGLQVWGWGTPLTTTFTQDVSYGYPGGMNIAPINDVVIQ